jgi:hypothetical protein
MLYRPIPGLIHDKDLSAEGTITLYMIGMIVYRRGNNFRNFCFIFGVVQRVERDAVIRQPLKGLRTGMRTPGRNDNNTIAAVNHGQGLSCSREKRQSWNGLLVETSKYFLNDLWLQLTGIQPSGAAIQTHRP